jgi:tRNA A-37 threonylcarbamoyl transferase component Bud32
VARPPLGPGPAPTGITAQLEAVPGAERYPARHDVHDALLVRGEERIPVVVKRIRRDFRQGEGNTRAERALRIARHLAAHGIDTPEPLGIEVTPEESVLVVRKLDGAVQIRAFFLRRDDPGREEPPVRASFEEVVTALGRFARRLHDAGVFFRDLSDGNVLVTGGEGGPRLWLVDLDRARIRKRPLRMLNRLRDLSRPGLGRAADRQLLLRSYWAPGPVPPLAPLLHAGLKRRIDAWNRLKRILRPWRR